LSGSSKKPINLPDQKEIGQREPGTARQQQPGLLPVDKPVGVTSFDVIRRLKPFFRGARLGHAGTLDPAASGLLLVCVGAATRLVSYFQEMPKTYLAEVLLGTITESDDLDGRVLETRPVPDLAATALEALYARFTGAIMQRPPAFSALKLNGVRAYTLARQGKCPELRERPVHIYSIVQRAREGARLSLEIQCSSGTYIRSLARDLGEALGCGGCLAALRRTRIGDFSVENAYSLSAGVARESAGVRGAGEFSGAARGVGEKREGGDAEQAARIRAKWLDLADCLGEDRLLPVTDEEAKHLSHGLIPRALEPRLQNYHGDLIGLLHPDGGLCAVLRQEKSTWRFVFTQDAAPSGGD